MRSHYLLCAFRQRSRAAHLERTSTYPAGIDAEAPWTGEAQMPDVRAATRVAQLSHGLRVSLVSSCTAPVLEAACALDEAVTRTLACRRPATFGEAVRSPAAQQAGRCPRRSGSKGGQWRRHTLCACGHITSCTAVCCTPRLESCTPRSYHRGTPSYTENTHVRNDRGDTCLSTTFIVADDEPEFKPDGKQLLL